MNPTIVNPPVFDSTAYARCIELSRRIRWDIDRDVIQDRTFDKAARFLPKGLARSVDLDFLSATDRCLLNQIEGRTYANMFGLVERFITAKILEISREHWLGDQVALEALVRFSEEELKHQELFRRIEALAGDCMPPGYCFAAGPNAVAAAVLAAPTWSVLALTCHIELFTQVHYRTSIDADHELSPLYKDVFLFHWKEESQHAVLDELEWRREDARLTGSERERAVDQLINLIKAVDTLLQSQASADTKYFLSHSARALSARDLAHVWDALLKDYRWQFIVSGTQDRRFNAILRSLVTHDQHERIRAAIEPLTAR